MRRHDFNDLAAFAVVADEASFSRAAARLAMSPSALSHAMKKVEERLGLRLLARTTRSVSTTEAGARLLQTLRPALGDIEAELASLTALRATPRGTVRITTPRHAAHSVLWPRLPRFLASHPDIRIELSIDEGLTDIVAGRYDAGVRFGERIEKDMVAVRISGPVQPCVVAAPAYLHGRDVPKKPQDLARHACLNYRYATSGGLYAWEFGKAGKAMEIKVDGPWVFNDSDLILAAALAGQGLAYLFDDQVLNHVQAGRLVRVLEAWLPPFPAYYLYHPSRRQVPPALAAFVAALRAPAPGPGIAAAPRELSRRRRK